MRDLAQAPEEARAVGLELGAAADTAARRQDVHEIPARLVAARPARAENRVAIGQQRRLDEQVAEGRVREVAAFRRQHDLGVAGQLDLAHGRAAIDHRDAAQLDVVFRRHGDLGVDVDGAVATPEDRAIRAEDDLVVVWLDQRAADRSSTRPRRLRRSRTKQNCPQSSVGAIFAPARQRQAAARAVAAAGIGHHDGVRAVGQQVRARARRVRRGVAAADRRRRRARRADVAGLLGGRRR